ncbi:hypothetical protein [Solirubrobacter soli]|uniref:hypothetical protein n=1 Tax=Solirubrobacter soli TaxID=363832 RepID=UPI0004296C62|nr:hypothetical protein [Solirubrobacter soli]
MMRVPVLAAGMLVAALPATASAAGTTPAGAATIATVPDVPSVCGAAFVPTVSVAWRVVVGDGGQGGTVRPVVRGVVGDPVELPATPGTYTFPAPHVFSGGACGETVGIVQTTGAHAIVEDANDTHLIVERDGQADERIDDARLTTTLVTEPDKDGDLRGDLTEDRTDLRIATKATRDPDGRARIEVTLTNAGPLAADLPMLNAASLPGLRWETCTPLTIYPACITPRLDARASRTFLLLGDAPEALAGQVSVGYEGTDTAPANDSAAVTLAAAPAFDVAAATSQRLSKGIAVRARGIRAGRARISVAFTRAGKTVKIGRVVRLAPYTARDVTIRPAGAKLRSLRRMLAGGAVGAEITIRTIQGKTPVTTKVTVTR